jgi:Mrp family chromosome partitioning ATPase
MEMMALAARNSRTIWECHLEATTARYSTGCVADTADEFDLIVIDDGLSSTESVLLGFPSFLDNVIMVVESGYTRRDQLQEGLEALKESRAKLTGAVVAA